MTTSPLAEVRASCAWVMAVGERVEIAGDVGAYARTFDLERVRRPAWDEEHHFVGTEDETVAYVLTLDTVNFGSGWFPHLRKRPGMSGYHTIASRLADRFRAEGPIPADTLAGIRARDVARIFDQPLEDPHVAELMELFAGAWRELGVLLLGPFAGSASRLAASAEGRASELVQMLAAMPSFQDTATFRGRRVSFYKRAQIAASDLALALDGRGLGGFEDLDRLTIFADDLVPHVLHVDGILAYRDDLRARIARGDLLDPGSPEEIEIRAGAVDAVERMVGALRAGGVDVTARELDVALWNRGQSPRYQEAPRHRTRTVFY